MMTPPPALVTVPTLVTMALHATLTTTSVKIVTCVIMAVIVPTQKAAIIVAAPVVMMATIASMRLMNVKTILASMETVLMASTHIHVTVMKAILEMYAMSVLMNARTILVTMMPSVSLSLMEKEQAHSCVTVLAVGLAGSVISVISITVLIQCVTDHRLGATDVQTDIPLLMDVVVSSPITY